jgi:Nif-specific regulatory protein
MSVDAIESLSNLASRLAEADGLRNGAAAVSANLAAAMGARFAFVIGLQDDRDVADLLAAEGLGVADFRRLETRISKSGLWRILELKRPMIIDELAKDNILNFLGYATGCQVLLTVPVVLHNECLGLISVGFLPGDEPRGRGAISILNAAAAMTAQAIKVEAARSRESQKLVEENQHLRQELKEKYSFRRIIGNSSPMRQVYDQVTQVARSNATVLLRGEIGTGKELIANTIHHNSLRSKRPFAKVSCGAFSSELVNAELFGQERVNDAGPRKGRIEAADGGTLFLEEIGSLPRDTQSRLLHLIEERRFVRVGGNDPVDLNIRLVASTSFDLEGAVASGTFDEELFKRLGPFSIFLPPLRDRKSDILLLAEHFLENFEEQYKKDIRRISTPAIDMLAAYHFPGNVRELENAIESAVIGCDSKVIHGHHLPPTLQTAEVSGTQTRVTLASAVESFERDLIQDSLKSTRGNIAEAARMLDSTERILGYKIGKYGLDPKRFKR